MLSTRENELWQYLTERQSIYHRRFVLQQPWPWTLDPILQKWQFPNVYRSLDAGTIFLTRELLPELTRGNVLLNLVCYRHFNTIDAARRLLPISGPLPQNIHLFVEGVEPYTNAYRTSPFLNLGGLSPLENSQIASYSWAEICPAQERHLGGMTMKDVMTFLTDLPGIGRFVAYVIACDLIYTQLVNYTENSDVFPFTGSASCAEWIQGWPSGTMDYLQVKLEMCRLFEAAKTELPKRNFPFLKDESGGDLHLTLRGIEDGCCELMRYRKFKAGWTNGRRFNRQTMLV